MALDAKPQDVKPMKPEEILKIIAAQRGSAICVPTMTTSPAWRTLAPDDLSVGCVGFMGGASSIGLGLALALPDRRVIVMDGDGSLLMQLGSLATVAGAAPRNLLHFLFKNGVYHTSGAQGIPGGLSVDFVAMDGQVPIFYMIGLLSREKDKAPRESRHSMVRYCEPLLDTFGVPHARLEGPDDVHLIPEYYRLSRARKGPAVVLVGLETI